MIQIERNKIKNPNCMVGGNQLAIYKRGWGSELGTTEGKSSKSGTGTWVRRIASPTRWPLGHAASLVSEKC